MISVLFIAAFAPVCAGLGWSMIARCDREAALTTPERLAAAFVVGTLAIYFAVFAVGPFRLDKMSMGIVALVAAVLAIPGLRAMPWAAIRTGGREVLAQARDPWIAVLWLAVFGIGASSFLQGLAPPNDYDSLMYHLAIPQYDVESGRITPAWGHGLANAFFPAGLYHLYRLALMFADGGAAQMIHGLFGVVAAVATASLARRMGAGPRVALLAAVMFLAVRAVVWEMGTVEGDVGAAAWFALALVVYVAWRARPAAGLLLLLGLLLGGGISTKYHGGVAALAIGALLAVDLVRGRVGLGRVVLVPAIAMAVFLPHLIQSYFLTGNPLFPLFHARIVPGGTAFFGVTDTAYGTGRGLFDLLTAPISMSLAPMHFYDGMVLGAPFLLALAPLSFLVRRRLVLAGPVLSAAFVFYALWFYFLGHQVRFLMSIYPIFAAFAAIGAGALWERTAPVAWARAGFVFLTGTLVLNQALFVGAYTALRLPVSLGLQSPEAYHRTPTMNGAAYVPCMYVRAHLAPGEKYLSLVTPHFYYCPQASAQLRFLPGEEKTWLRADGALPPLSPAEFAVFFEANAFRFVIITLSRENRRNDTGESRRATADWSADRFGRFVAPAIGSLTPLSQDAFVAVYDGRAVLAELKKAAGR